MRIYVSSWIPVVTSTCFTVAPLYTKTYSFIFGIPPVEVPAAALAALAVSAAPDSRVVTACIGTDKPVSCCVWISTVADKPGRKGDGLGCPFFNKSAYDSGKMRTFTLKLVT